MICKMQKELIQSQLCDEDKLTILGEAQEEKKKVTGNGRFFFPL